MIIQENEYPKVLLFIKSGVVKLVRNVKFRKFNGKINKPKTRNILAKSSSQPNISTRMKSKFYNKDISQIIPSEVSIPKAKFVYPKLINIQERIKSPSVNEMESGSFYEREIETDSLSAGD